MDNTEQLAEMVIKAAQIFIDKKFAPIMEEIAAIKRNLELQQKTIPTVKDIQYIASGQSLDACAKLLEAIPRPANGKDADPKEIAAEVARQIALVPAPTNGAVDLGAIFAEIGVAVDRAAAAIPKPADGKSVTLDDVKPFILEAIAAIPPAPRGVAGVAGVAGEIGPQGPAGKDADLSVLNELVTVHVKAAIAQFRPPEKGDPGKDAEPLDMDEIRHYLTGEVQRELAGWERPKDGADGLGFDDMSVDLKEDGRTMTFRFKKGEREKCFDLVYPLQIYRGVYKRGQHYQRGDQVTYGGSQFTAKADTDSSPETSDWVLSVKRGKDAA